MNQSNEYLIKRAKRGNAKAQKALYERHKMRWFMICLRYAKSRQDAEDMLQDGLVSLFRNLDKFDDRKAAFGTWSHQIMVNAALQYLRKWKRLEFSEGLDSAMRQGHDGGILDNINAKELTRMVQRLPDGYRTVFNLYAIEGYSHAEIAKQLDISVGASKSQLFKAKKLLRHWVESFYIRDAG